ncbi:hypothetical protein [Zavarzinella formosa]|uniref:hypothetical protein n=1 Tax=Zavarzinella formosa TaxID=360055 RepID=UPI0002F9DDE1|nr:hypothetical protein [Zavarzinella formosa]
MPTLLKKPAKRSSDIMNPDTTGDVLRGLVEKNRIVTDLIDGRVSLKEAAGRFQKAHVAGGQCLERTTGVPSRSVETENTCRSLIGWVRLTLRDRPEQADRVTARLEDELSAATGGGSTMKQQTPG